MESKDQRVDRGWKIMRKYRKTTQPLRNRKKEGTKKKIYLAKLLLHPVTQDIT